MSSYFHPAEGLTAVPPGDYTHVNVPENNLAEFDPALCPRLEVLHIAGNPIRVLPAMTLSELVYGLAQDASQVACPVKIRHAALR